MANPECLSHAKAIASLEATDRNMAEILRQVSEDQKEQRRVMEDIRRDIATLPQRLDERYVRRDEDFNKMKATVEQLKNYMIGMGVLYAAAVALMQYGAQILKFLRG